MFLQSAAVLVSRLSYVSLCLRYCVYGRLVSWVLCLLSCVSCLHKFDFFTRRRNFAELLQAAAVLLSRLFYEIWNLRLKDIWLNLLLSFTYKWPPVSRADISQSLGGGHPLPLPPMQHCLFNQAMNSATLGLIPRAPQAPIRWCAKTFQKLHCMNCIQRINSQSLEDTQVGYIFAKIHFG